MFSFERRTMCDETAKVSTFIHLKMYTNNATQQNELLVFIATDYNVSPVGYNAWNWCLFFELG